MLWFFIFIFILCVIVLVGFFVVAILSLIANVWTAVPYVETPDAGIQKILSSLKVQKTDRLIDLGAGDGRVLEAFERRFGVVGRGYEISLWPWLLSQRRLRGLRSRVYFKNFYHVDLRDVDVVFCYLTQTVMNKLGAKLLRELKKGARVVAYGPNFPKWKPYKVIPADDAHGQPSQIYFYEI